MVALFRLEMPKERANAADTPQLSVIVNAVGEVRARAVIAAGAALRNKPRAAAIEHLPATPDIHWPWSALGLIHRLPG